MSDLMSRFRADFDLWVRMLRTDGEPEEGIEEIRETIRAAWHDEELRKLWIEFVAEKAAFVRELDAMVFASLERIKAEALKKAA